jgi:hypothetical protein
MAAADDQLREEVARLIADADLLALRVRACETVSRALSEGAQYLHIPAALGDDRNVKGLSLVADMSADLTQGALLLFKAERWYSGEALIRQMIETEYLLSLFVSDPGAASRWLDASEKELRQWWNPGAMREHLKGEFDDREYWDHCERGGHPVPGARPFLDGFAGTFDRRFCWIDFAGHCRRLLTASVRCFVAFGFSKHVEEDAYAEAYEATELWLNTDPAPSKLGTVPRV